MVPGRRTGLDGSCAWDVEFLRVERNYYSFDDERDFDGYGEWGFLDIEWLQWELVFFYEWGRRKMGSWRAELVGWIGIGRADGRCCWSWVVISMIGLA